MNAAVSMKPIADWTDIERATLRELSQTVYPPEEASAWPGRELDWTAAEWGIRVVNSEGELVSFTGVVLRQVKIDGRSVWIGGVGGVKTHPAARRRGYAAIGLQRAMEFFHEQPDVEFALLVCEPELIEYYSRLGWKQFKGRLLTMQKGETEEFTFDRVMVIDVRSAGPMKGTLDLQGPPW